MGLFENLNPYEKRMWMRNNAQGARVAGTILFWCSTVFTIWHLCQYTNGHWYEYIFMGFLGYGIQKGILTVFEGLFPIRLGLFFSFGLALTVLGFIISVFGSLAHNQEAAVEIKNSNIVSQAQYDRGKKDYKYYKNMIDEYASGQAFDYNTTSYVSIETLPEKEKADLKAKHEAALTKLEEVKDVLDRWENRDQRKSVTDSAFEGLSTFFKKINFINNDADGIKFIIHLLYSLFIDACSFILRLLPIYVSADLKGQEAENVMRAALSDYYNNPQPKGLPGGSDPGSGPSGGPGHGPGGGPGGRKPGLWDKLKQNMGQRFDEFLADKKTKKASTQKSLPSYPGNADFNLKKASNLDDLKKGNSVPEKKLSPKNRKEMKEPLPFSGTESVPGKNSVPDTEFVPEENSVPKANSTSKINSVSEKNSVPEENSVPKSVLGRQNSGQNLGQKSLIQNSAIQKSAIQNLGQKSPIQNSAIQKSAGQNLGQKSLIQNSAIQNSVGQNSPKKSSPINIKDHIKQKDSEKVEAGKGDDRKTKLIKEWLALPEDSKPIQMNQFAGAFLRDYVEAMYHQSPTQLKKGWLKGIDKVAREIGIPKRLGTGCHEFLKQLDLVQPIRTDNGQSYSIAKDNMGKDELLAALDKKIEGVEVIKIGKKTS